MVKNRKKLVKIGKNRKKSSTLDVFCENRRLIKERPACTSKCRNHLQQYVFIMATAVKVIHCIAILFARNAVLWIIYTTITAQQQMRFVFIAIAVVSS